MKHITLAFFIDSLGWITAQENSFLEKKLKHRRAVKSVLGYTCTAIPTVLTGELPCRHGNLFYLYQTGSFPFKAAGPVGLVPNFVNKRSIPGWGRLPELVRRLYGYTGFRQFYNVPLRYIEHFDYCRMKDVFEIGGMAPYETIFDVLHKNGIPYYVTDWREGENFSFHDLERTIRQGRVELAFMYTTGLDSLLHMTGRHDPRVSAKLEFYERKIMSLMDCAARYYDDVSVFVFSDHGMYEVTYEFDLQSVVDRLGLVYGKDYVAVYDATIARFWFKTKRARLAVTGLLATVDCGRMLSKDELKRWGVYFPDGRFGELFFLMHEGVIIQPSFMGAVSLAGMHGYDPEKPGSDAALLCSDDKCGDISELTGIKKAILSSVLVKPTAGIESTRQAGALAA